MRKISLFGVKMELPNSKTCLIQYFTLILHCYFVKVNMKNESKIINYLHDSFGWNVEIENFDAFRGRLPYVLLSAAEFSVVRCNDFKGVAIEPKPEYDFRMIRNLVNTVERKTGIPALLILENLDAYQRRVLIDNRTNFIVPDRQIFFPVLGILLNERGLGVRQSKSDMLSVVAVAMVVYQLTKRNLQGKSVSQIAEIMGYSVKTLSLAVNELEQNGFVAFRQEGRKKLMDFILSPKEMWEKIYDMSDSPVEKRMFTVNDEIMKEIGVKASDSALSDVSMLAPPQQPVYAVYARNPRLRELNLNQNDGTSIIEVWKTDPKLTAVNGNLDIFSLALSYKDDDDPRVKKEIDKILTEKL